MRREEDEEDNVVSIREEGTGDVRVWYKIPPSNGDYLAVSGPMAVGGEKIPQANRYILFEHRDGFIRKKTSDKWCEVSYFEDLIQGRAVLWLPLTDPHTQNPHAFTDPHDKRSCEGGRR